MLRLMPNILALMAVQRHTAASRSTKPSRTLQQGNFGGWPILSLIKFRTFAHTPSLSASWGQEPEEGDGLGEGLGLPGGGGHEVEETKEKRRFTERRRAVIAKALLAILL